MNGDEVLAVLREIRDEVRQTNVRLAELDTAWRRQVQSEPRLITAVLSLTTVTHELKDVLVNANLAELKARVAKLEEQVSDRHN